LSQISELKGFIPAAPSNSENSQIAIFETTRVTVHTEKSVVCMHAAEDKVDIRQHLCPRQIVLKVLMCLKEKLGKLREKSESHHFTSKL
jgi:hypothetical protein